MRAPDRKVSTSGETHKYLYATRVLARIFSALISRLDYFFLAFFVVSLRPSSAKSHTFGSFFCTPGFSVCTLEFANRRF